jgi:riboflavin kinase/FMN adenylyltransferase
MRYIENTKQFQLKNTAVSLGKFEGMHKGHQALFARILESKANGLVPVVFTFDFRLDRNMCRKQTILTKSEKISAFEKLGVDVVVDYPFDESAKNMEAKEFIEKVLIGQMDAKQIVAGTDFCFGRGRRGNVALLKEMEKKYGYELLVVEKLKYKEQEISSTRIRECILAGNMEEANIMLGYPYRIEGKVMHGRKIGRTLGMPTANLIPESEKLLPPNGVYASVTVIEEEAYEGITNIGYKPTVGAEPVKGVETYIFDYRGDLYGKKIEVNLYTFERPEMKFPDLNALRVRMHMDIEFGRAYFHNYRENLK